MKTRRVLVDPRRELFIDYIAKCGTGGHSQREVYTVCVLLPLQLRCCAGEGHKSVGKLPLFSLPWTALCVTVAA